MIRLLSAFAAAALGLVAASAPPASARAPEPQLESGFGLLYQLRFPEGRAQFQEWLRTHPGDPVGQTAMAASYLFEEFDIQGVLTSEFFLDDDRLLGGIVGKADPARTRAFRDANRHAREVASRRLAKNPSDSRALLAMTLVTGMESDYAGLIEKRQMESLRLTREAERYGKRLLAVAPDADDAYMALGASNYILACLPSYKRAFLWFGGIRGDRQTGIRQLESAANGGRYLKPFAKMMLALVWLREKQPARARGLLNSLVSEFPGCALFTRERAKLDSPHPGQ
jgi:hypothetical protein